MKKRKQFSGALIVAAIGAILLTIDRLSVSADTSDVSFAESVSVLTITAILFFMVAVIWIYKVMMD